MADVTISNLPLGAIDNTTAGFIPATINNQTVRLPLSGIPNASYDTPDRPFIIAFASNPNGMGKSGSTGSAAVANEAIINSVFSYSGNSNTMLNPSTYEITVPKTGVYLIQPALGGYVPSASWNIRAGFIVVNINGVSNFVTNYSYFNATWSYSNTHWRWAPTYYYPLNAGDKLKMYYGCYAGGDSLGFYALDACYITVCMI